MRVLLSTVPAAGHVIALLPLARALRDRGHDLAVISAGSVRPLLPAGVPLLEAGPDLPELLERIRRSGLVGEEAGVDPVSPEGIGRFFGTLRVSSTISDARSHARAWAPDLVVSEGLDGVGPVLAAELGLPHATVTLGPVCSGANAAALRGHATALGLPWASTHWFDTWPVALRPPGWEPPRPSSPLRTALGHAASTGKAGETGEAGAADPFPPGDGPAVLLTFGTLFDDPAALGRLVDVVAAHGARVACVLGPRHPTPAPVGDGARVRVHRFTPLAPALAACDAVVCHGGAGTVLAAALYRRPVLVLPQGLDHHLVGAGVTAAGSGLVRADDVAPGEIVAALDALLTDPAHAAATRRVGDEIDAMPTADVVAAALVAAPAAPAGRPGPGGSPAPAV